MCVHTSLTCRRESLFCLLCFPLERFSHSYSPLYINLNAAGVKGQIYANTFAQRSTRSRQEQLKDLRNDGDNMGVTGGFGNVNTFGAEVYPACRGVSSSPAPDGLHPKNLESAYRYGMAQQHDQNRQAQALQSGYDSYDKTRQSGF